MDREYRHGLQRHYTSCKHSAEEEFEKDLIARLRQISLTSTLHRDSSYRKERRHDCCRSWSASKSRLRSKWCRAAACHCSSALPRLCNSRHFGIVHDSPCVHLCIIGEKMTLHQRNQDQNSFLTRAKNYSRSLKERNHSMQRQCRVSNQNTLSSSDSNKCQKHSCQLKSRHFFVPQMTAMPPSSSQSESDSANCLESHRYVLYRRRSTGQEESQIEILSPTKSYIRDDKNRVKEHRLGMTGRMDSGCISTLSFSNVDLTTKCRTPDNGSRITSPLPPRVAGMYPVACPVFPLLASFPACVIPEPDV